MKKVLFAILLLSGCVTKSAYNKDLKLSYNSGYQQANLECYDLQMRIKGYVESLQERLRKFNQLNEDNSLRDKKNDDSKGWNQSNGSNDE